MLDLALIKYLKYSLFNLDKLKFHLYHSSPSIYGLYQLDPLRRQHHTLVQ